MDETKHTAHESAGHERSDVGIGPIAMLVTGLAVLTIVALLAMWGLFRYFAAREAKTLAPPSPMAESRQLPPAPRLQVIPERDLQQLRKDEDKFLNSYDWVSREAGVVRIPIDRAMDLVVERGLPVRAENQEQRAKSESQGAQR
jgi:hypothetical protein